MSKHIGHVPPHRGTSGAGVGQYSDTPPQKTVINQTTLVNTPPVNMISSRDPRLASRMEPPTLNDPPLVNPSDTLPLTRPSTMSQEEYQRLLSEDYRRFMANLTNNEPSSVSNDRQNTTQPPPVPVINAVRESLSANLETQQSNIQPSRIQRAIDKGAYQESLSEERQQFKACPKTINQPLGGPSFIAPDLTVPSITTKAPSPPVDQEAFQRQLDKEYAEFMAQQEQNSIPRPAPGDSQIPPLVGQSTLQTEPLPDLESNDVVNEAYQKQLDDEYASFLANLEKKDSRNASTQPQVMFQRNPPLAPGLPPPGPLVSGHPSFLPNNIQDQPSTFLNYAPTAQNVPLFSLFPERAHDQNVPPKCSQPLNTSQNAGLATTSTPKPAPTIIISLSSVSPPPPNKTSETTNSSIWTQRDTSSSRSPSPSLSGSSMRSVRAPEDYMTLVTIEYLNCLKSSCKQTCPTLRTLNEHLKDEHLINRFRCPILSCTFSTNTPSKLAPHGRAKHSKNRDWPCKRDNCLKRFKTQEELSAHLEMSHMSGRFHCTFEGCDFVATECQEKVKEHFKEHLQRNVSSKQQHGADDISPADAMPPPKKSKTSSYLEQHQDRDYRPASSGTALLTRESDALALVPFEPINVQTGSYHQDRDYRTASSNAVSLTRESITLENVPFEPINVQTADHHQDRDYRTASSGTVSLTQQSVALANVPFQPMNVQSAGHHHQAIQSDDYEAINMDISPDGTESPATATDQSMDIVPLASSPVESILGPAPSSRTSTKAHLKSKSNPSSSSPSIAARLPFRIEYLECLKGDCMERSSSTFALNVHLESAHGIHLHRCPNHTCKANFTDSRQLLEHQQTAHGTEPVWKCRCQATFPTASALTDHYTIDHFSGLFTCTVADGCTFQARTRALMYAHSDKKHRPAMERENSKQTKYLPISLSCPAEGCREFARNEQELSLHLRSAHQKMPFACLVARCKQSFTTRTQLDLHIGNVHWDRVLHNQWPCSECAHLACSHQKLCAHQRLVHLKGLFKCSFHGCRHCRDTRQGIIDHYDSHDN